MSERRSSDFFFFFFWPLVEAFWLRLDCRFFDFDSAFVSHPCASCISSAAVLSDSRQLDEKKERKNDDGKD